MLLLTVSPSSPASIRYVPNHWREKYVRIISHLTSTLPTITIKMNYHPINLLNRPLNSRLVPLLTKCPGQTPRSCPRCILRHYSLRFRTNLVYSRRAEMTFMGLFITDPIFCVVLLALRSALPSSCVDFVCDSVRSPSRMKAALVPNVF